jgi:ceramide glucosyltransferase
MFASVAWVVLALLSTATTVRRPPPPARVHPGVSVLRPLAGADPSLEQNLESLFRQGYPSFEILLGVESTSDPAWALAERVCARYPHVPSRIVATGEEGAKNPKVRNLLGLLPYARFDLVVVSDSNVSVPEGYLDDLVATREHTGAGLVTSLFSCEGEEGLFGAVECAQIVGYCAPSACLPTALGHAAVIGKSMLFSRRELDALGGLRKVSDVLAEDFVLGKMYEHAGKRVAVASRVISNVTGRVSASTFFARQRRWAALRFRLSPMTFVLEGATNPFVLSGLAALFAPSHSRALGLGVMLATILLRDVGGWLVLRGWRRAWIPLVVWPVKDVLVLAAWLSAPFTKTLRWRGRSLRLGAGTILYATDGR